MERRRVPEGENGESFEEKWRLIGERGGRRETLRKATVKIQEEREREESKENIKKKFNVGELTKRKRRQGIWQLKVVVLHVCCVFHKCHYCVFMILLSF